MTHRIGQQEGERGGGGDMLSLMEVGERFESSEVEGSS